MQLREGPSDSHMTLRFRSLAASVFLFASSLSVTACAWTSDGGLGERVESDVRTKSSPEGSWQGEPLRVHDEHGQIEIVGVPGKANITVRAKMVAGARSQADADAAFADLFESIVIEKQAGAWVVACDHARAWHGSVDPESTGCTRMTVEIPAGTIDAPIALDVSADYGGMHASGIVVSKLHASGPFGMLADVTPAKGADIELRGRDLASGFCSSIVRVPAGFAADEVALSVENVQVKYVDDPNGRYVPGVGVEGLPSLAADSAIAPRTASFRGAAGEKGTGAARIVVHAQMGRALVTTHALPPAEDMHACAKYEPIEVNAQL